MKGTVITPEELDALSGRSWLAQLLYLRALRPFMDYGTGVVGGPKRRISYQSISEELHRDVRQGRHSSASGYPTTKELRSALAELEKDLSEEMHPRPAVIKRLEADRQLVFFLPLAASDKSASNMRGRRGADVGQTMSGTPKPNCDAGSSDMSGRRGADPKEPMRGTHPESVNPEKIKDQYIDQAPDENAQDSQPADAGESDRPKAGKNHSTASRFEGWWQQYPRKVGTKAAREKWKAKGLDAQADQLVADVQLRAGSDRKWLDGYIPNPLTYLTQERWEDEIERTRPQLRAVGGGRRGAEGNDQAIQNFIDNFAEGGNP
jgi:hypothetical protein